LELTFSDGEVLLVDTDESMRIPEGVKNGAVYILRWGRAGDELSIKRVHLDWAERQIIAVSDNELYRPKAIDLDEASPLGHYLLAQVIWVGKENI
jgi:phage repressor protein C with HTH and peptisase S24 domain